MSNHKKITASAPDENNEKVSKHTSYSRDGETNQSIRQNSAYGHGNRPAIDNNLFWQDRSNELSSKGE